MDTDSFESFLKKEKIDNEETNQKLLNLSFNILSKILDSSGVAIRYDFEDDIMVCQGDIGLQIEKDRKSLALVSMKYLKRKEFPIEKINVKDAKFVSEEDNGEYYGWIRTAKHLPELKELVLVCKKASKGSMALVASLSKENDPKSFVAEIFINEQWVIFPVGEVTHWMPLPRPPVNVENQDSHESKVTDLKHRMPFTQNRKKKKKKRK